ncbi:MAG: ABC transporter ATP-binding protein [Phycisphaeraceae bacterium]
MTAATTLQPAAQQRAPHAGSKESDVLVRLVNVHKSFGSLRVLGGISLDIQRGQTTVILGPSGTGKSVLLKHIVGLLRPDKGEVYFEGQRVDQMKEHDLVDIRKKIGFLFQMGALFDSKSVGDNVAFPLVEHTKMNAKQRLERSKTVLKMVGLEGIENKMPGELSGGQRKRVALARAVVMEPALILYDEPTTGLDPIMSDVINELIVTLAKRTGVTGIAVTHDISSARKIADRMVLIYDGQVVADADSKAFLESKNEVVQRFVQGKADETELAAIRRGFEERS